MTQPLSASVHNPSIQYVTTDDGYRIAYSVSGTGEPFLCTPCLLKNDILRPQPGEADFLDAVEARFRLIQYDGRGTGNSTRGVDPHMTIEDTARDILALISELRLDNIVLYGHVVSTYTIFSVAAKLHGSIRAVVLVAPSDFTGTPLLSEFEEMYTQDWELFTNLFTATFEPLGSSGQWMREAVNHEDFLSLVRSAAGRFLTDLLPHVKVPVLILCPRSPTLPSTHPAARKIASAIPGAELVFLDGRRLSDILCSLNGSPPTALPVIEDFLERIDDCPFEYGGSNETTSAQLSARELEVLRLLAAGKTNPRSPRRSSSARAPSPSTSRASTPRQARPTASRLPPTPSATTSCKQSMH